MGVGNVCPRKDQEALRRPGACALGGEAGLGLEATGSLWPALHSWFPRLQQERLSCCQSPKPHFFSNPKGETPEDTEGVKGNPLTYFGKASSCLS